MWVATIVITNWKEKHSSYLTFKASGIRCRIKESLRYSREPPLQPRLCLIILFLHALSFGHCEDTTPRRSLIAVLMRSCRGENRYLDLYNFRLLLLWRFCAPGGAGIQTTTQLGFSAPPENCTWGGQCCCSGSSPPSSSVSVSTVSSTCTQEGSGNRHVTMSLPVS